MKTLFKATLAAVLLAGVSTAALAQEHDQRERGGAPQARGQAAPAPAAAAPQARWHGGPQGAGMARPPGAPGQDFQHRGEGRDQGQRFQGQPPGAPGPQRFERGQAPGPGPGPGRQWDHERGPHEVIPPTGERGWDGRRDASPGRSVEGRSGRDGAWNGRGHDARDGRWAGGHGGERWERGRFPPVYWSQQRYRIGAYRAPYGFYARSWGFGDFLPRGWYGQNYWLGDFIDFGLPYPPPGYEWVRVGDDAIMVDQYTGRVVQVVRGIFW